MQVARDEVHMNRINGLNNEFLWFLILINILPDHSSN